MKIHKIVIFWSLFSIIFCAKVLFAEEMLNVSDYYPLSLGSFWFYASETGDFTDRVISYDGCIKFVVRREMDKYGSFNRCFSVTKNHVLMTDNEVLTAFGSPIGKPAIILKAPLKIGTVIDDQKTKDDRFVAKIIKFVNCDVEAGHFENVCVVQEKEILFKKKRHYTSITNDYYAPHVGLIKDEVTKDEITEYLQGRKIKPLKPYVIFELSKYHIESTRSDTQGSENNLRNEFATTSTIKTNNATENSHLQTTPSVEKEDKENKDSPNKELKENKNTTHTSEKDEDLFE